MFVEQARVRGVIIKETAQIDILPAGIELKKLGVIDSKHKLVAIDLRNLNV